MTERTKDGNLIKTELCTELKDYEETGLHIHDIISTRHMVWYNVYSGSTSPDNKIRINVSDWHWGSQWLPNVTDWEYEREFIDYDVSDYTVFEPESG